MKDLNTYWPPEKTCKCQFKNLKELREDSMVLKAEVGGKNYAREDKGMDR